MPQLHLESLETNKRHEVEDYHARSSEKILPEKTVPVMKNETAEIFSDTVIDIYAPVHENLTHGNMVGAR